MSKSDQDDFQRFFRFFKRKIVQIIVQARLGEKLKTPCKPNSSGADWFNLCLPDMNDITTHLKKATEGKLSQNFCVEISLKTPDEETLVLENWYVELDNANTQPEAKIRYTVYNKMSMVLKSLLVCTRNLPAYRLSRQQGPDTFSLFYRVLCESPSLHCLGIDQGHLPLGRIGTPYGTLTISLGYRTQLTFVPRSQQLVIEHGIKEDHFDATPGLGPEPCRLESQEFHNHYGPPPFSKVPNGTVPVSSFEEKEVANRRELKSPTGFTIVRPAAFAESRPIPSKEGTPVPFENLLFEETETFTAVDAASDGLASPTEPPPKMSKTPKEQDVEPENTAFDDFVLVEMPAAFVRCEHEGDLKDFYRCFQNAPKYPFNPPPDDRRKTPPASCKLEEEFKQQFSMFQSKAEEFDQFVELLNRQPVA